jgi:hypothetical protein
MRSFTTLLLLAAVILSFICFHRIMETHKVSGLRSQCRFDLNQIQYCKKVWMEDNHKTTNDIPGWSDLTEYLLMYGIPDGKPVCQKGGTYTLGRVGEWPKCSIGGVGHTMGTGNPTNFVTQ